MPAANPEQELAYFAKINHNYTTKALLPVFGTKKGQYVPSRQTH